MKYTIRPSASAASMGPPPGLMAFTIRPAASAAPMGPPPAPQS